MTEIAINVFIVIYVLQAYLWNAPNDTPLKPLLSLYRPVVRYLGLWHTWAMFAPNPFLATRWIELELHFEDGETFLWRPDYHAGMSRWQKFRRERFRKIGENCREGEFGWVRGLLCEFVIRQFQEEQGSTRPIKHVLIHQVEEPSSDFAVPTPADTPVTRVVVYTHAVQ